jgi:hypothetical protein
MPVPSRSSSRVRVRRRSRRSGAAAPALVASIAVVALVACGTRATTVGGATPAASDPSGRRSRLVRIAAAGDIACAAAPHGRGDPDHCQYDDTSDLLVGRSFARVLALGDNQYDAGTFAAYREYYGPEWGRVVRRTSPVPGNHEYAQDPSARPRGYFRYFGNRVKGPDGFGYYSFDVPKGCTPGEGVCWHLIALSSELCFAPGGCGRASDPSDVGTGNRMFAWLRADLATHPQSEYPCTLAYWHHPLFSVSTESAGSAAVRPLWRLLYAARADVVLNGHSHNYQRWRPMAPSGARDPRHGIREFVVGTGGASKYALHPTRPPTLARAQSRSFGVLVLRLAEDGYSWTWRTARGQPSFADVHRATTPCR